MASSVTLRVFRWAPDQPEHVQEYRVAAAADTTVLDALVEVQRAQYPTLAFRYACRVGMCGSCAMVGHNERFPGPAALNRALTLELDHRDAGRDGRRSILLGGDALARCHGQGNCTEVCPMGLSPADSIRRLRWLTVLRMFGLSR